jgi:hypothetical protein
MNRFKKVLSAVGLLAIIAGIHAMESLPFNFSGLPSEIQMEILIKSVDSEIKDLTQEIEAIRQKEELEYERALAAGEDVDEWEMEQRNKKRKFDILTQALQKVKNFGELNKEFNLKMNDPRFIYRLIVDLSEKLDTYDEIIAKALASKAAQDRIQLQQDFVREMTGIGVQFSQKKFEDFIKRGVDLEWTDEFGWTPLFQVVDSNKLAAVKALVKAGVNVNYKNDDGMTALSLTVRPRSGYNPKFPISQRIEIIKFLIDSGADLFGNQELQRMEDPAFIAGLKKEVVEVIKQAQLNLRNYVRYVQPRPRKRVVNLSFIK